MLYLVFDEILDTNQNLENSKEIKTEYKTVFQEPRKCWFIKKLWSKISWHTPEASFFNVSHDYLAFQRFLRSFGFASFYWLGIVCFNDILNQTKSLEMSPIWSNNFCIQFLILLRSPVDIPNLPLGPVSSPPCRML